MCLHLAAYLFHSHKYSERMVDCQYGEDGLIQIVEWDFEGDGSFDILNNLSDIERPLLGDMIPFLG